MVFDITATGFGSGDMFLHWGVGKQPLEEKVLMPMCRILHSRACI